MYDANDILLNVISAKREVSWADYKRIYDSLYRTQIFANTVGEANINFKRSQTARAIDALGHCDFEFSKDLQRVFSTPPLLGRLPQTGLPKATLMGSRLPRTIVRLKELAKKTGSGLRVTLNSQPTAYVLVPRRVVVEADYVKDLTRFAESLAVKFENQPAAWSVINFSASLDQYMTTRSWSRRRDLNWPKRNFDFDLLMYTTNKQQDRGMRLSRYVDPVRNTNLHLLWKGDECAEVDGDWGRYAALRATGINVVMYDSKQFDLGVPSTVPLPKLIARSLTLCSGFLPKIVKFSGGASAPISAVSGIAIYKDVPPVVAEMAAVKLGQSLVSCSFDSNLEEID